MKTRAVFWDENIEFHIKEVHSKSRAADSWGMIRNPTN